MNKNKLFFFVSAAMVTLPFLQASLHAQGTATPAPASSAQKLNLPSNVTVLGKSVPNVRKATAIVNGEIITGTDVDERVALIIIANSAKLSPEQLEQLRQQVTRNIIDETLEIQEAKSNKIDVTDDEVEQRYAGVSKNFKRTTKQMDEYLTSIGSSAASLKRQIRGQIAWDRLLRRKVEPFVNVGQGEIDDIVQRLMAAKGQHEYRVSEIYNSATPETSAEVQANQHKILDQIKSGGSFAAYATQFSESSTASQGGDLGWVRQGVLPVALDSQLVNMRPGEVAGPIALPGGYDILYLADEREVLTADPRDATLALRQISVPFAPNITEDQAKAKTEEFAAATRVMQGCGQA
ncbi:MAG: peptidylprolyl isomerase, partial [Alphaproteobacteria bacterium]|nr:peptidylprolyl isomerase [Alphaproteobacteria bacterium]